MARWVVGGVELADVDHIGVAVGSLDTGAKAWATLGVAAGPAEEVPAARVRVAFLSVGDTRIELLEPLGDDCPVARFLERRGPGLHHIAFRVEELDGVLARLDRAGVPLVDHRGRPGAHGTRVAFLHPSALGGVLVELVEAARKGTSEEVSE